MPANADGPCTSRFQPVRMRSEIEQPGIAQLPASEQLREAWSQAPSGECVAWGLPFAADHPVFIADSAVRIDVEPVQGRWLVFMHTSDVRPLAPGSDGIVRPMQGEGRLNEQAADYVVVYADGQEERIPIRRRHHIGAFQRRWGENCFQAVPHQKPRPQNAHHEQMTASWGRSQTRADAADSGSWIYWLYAWENPRPNTPITAIQLEPVSGTVVLAAISYGDASEHPLRWRARRKALLQLPQDIPLDANLSDRGLLAQIQLDMGQVISAIPQMVYPDVDWSTSYNNQLPEVSANTVLVEYAAHPDASFHLWGHSVVPVAELEAGGSAGPLETVPPATQRVTLSIREKASGKLVAVKLHVHGEAGEYLAPLDRHRLPNPAWFEDYAPEFSHLGRHHTTYIPGETRLDLPLGQVFIEVSKGFEIRPLRQVYDIAPDTETIEITVERVLPWRQRGWVTADTHVHFLSPMTALLEGEGEGINVVNLLASQWGELMTNVGDFDGRNTWGSRQTGGEGEYLVRVGTENRQHVLGHISLLGYRDRIIAPMTTGGPDESALGDPIDILLTEWARQCHKQGGLVVLPHFPNPRAEHAAAIIEGDIDALEMTAWGNLYGGIDPYSLSDWYRYLNCGYPVPCVGGTDKMSATTAVGTVRTYARLPDGAGLDYQRWMDAVKRAETFVTYGPLLEFKVEGHAMGSRLELPSGGGTLDIAWEVASVTVPMTRVELVVNGEIRESVAVDQWHGGGTWHLKLGKSSWLALLVRGHYADQPEIIAAHSSAVMTMVGDSPFFAAADAVTILEQIEGALAYLDTVGTRKDTQTYRRMRLVLESAHRRIHNRLHQQGHYHEHTPTENHPEHRG